MIKLKHENPISHRLYLIRIAVHSLKMECFTWHQIHRIYPCLVTASAPILVCIRLLNNIQTLNISFTVFDSFQHDSGCNTMTVSAIMVSILKCLSIRFSYLLRDCFAVVLFATLTNPAQCKTYDAHIEIVA